MTRRRVAVAVAIITAIWLVQLFTILSLNTLTFRGTLVVMMGSCRTILAKTRMPAISTPERR